MTVDQRWRLNMKRLMKITIASILTLMLMMTSGVPLLAKDTEDYLDEIEQLRDLIMESYSGSDISEEEIFEAALEGMTSVLDKYSVFYDDVDAQTFLDSLSNEYVGIGVRLEVRYGQVVITEVFEGGAAYDADIQVNDIIYKVNGVEATEYDLNTLVEKIVGEKGTYVTIEFKRGGSYFTYEMERRKITIPTVMEIEEFTSEYGLDEALAEKVAALRVSSFAKDTDEDMAKKIDTFKAEGIKYLVLDMRDNGGGYLMTAVNMLKALVAEGPVVILYDKEGGSTTYKSALAKSPFTVVLVVDGNSASATEIFAAAIKDRKAGVVIGETTYGKGVAQNIYRLGDEYLSN